MGALEAIWWLGAAWLAAGFLRAFVVLGRQPRESKLVQDLLAGLIYLAATFAIIAYVCDLPVKGLLATSGALAIIIDLALQSSLGDVFSGIVLNIERPYRVGDWIILDDTLQGDRNQLACDAHSDRKPGCGDHPEQHHCEIQTGELQRANQDSRYQHPGEAGALADAWRRLSFAEGSAPRQHADPADA